MAYTAADLVTLDAARLRGVRTVQFGDRSVTYYSDAEFKQLREDILRELGQTSPTRRSKQVHGVTTSKGF